MSAAVQASTTTWAQAKAGNLRAHLDNLIVQNPAKANPTTLATVVANQTTTGGLLPTGLYYVAYTFLDGWGETLMAGESTQFNVTTAGWIPRVTLPALPTGCVQINVYLTPAGGASGSEVLYADGITTTTFDLAYAFPVDTGSTPPQANTTGAAIHAKTLRAILSLNADEGLANLSRLASNLVDVAAIPWRDVVVSALRLATFTKAWSVAVEEFRTLLHANPPTAISFVANGIMGRTVRTLP